MAEWRGMKVKLDNPTRIQKGEPGYGRKKFKVFVMDNGKVKKVMFGDPNMEIRKDNPKLELHFVPDINVLLLKIKQQQDTGLAKCGK